VVAQAPSHATANATGLTVSFGPNSADLSPASAAAIAALAHAVPQSDSISFNVLAYAHGQADDPSTARRLSLSRALAIRSALTAAGVSSTRIYLRALGAEAGSGQPDRADITVMGANAPAATAAVTPNATSGGKQE
jgi:outer membrane protein OmpA-like peptidoglycan-associated protein